MAEVEFGMRSLLISCTVQPSCLQEQECIWLSCLWEQGTAGPEVERVWFLPGAATGTAKSEGSLMRAQEGLQTHCPCPLSPVAVAQAQPCQSVPTVLGFSPTVAVWEPCSWCRGSRHVPVPSVGSPALHRSLQMLGKLPDNITTVPGVSVRGIPLYGVLLLQGSPFQLLVLGVSGPNPDISSHPAPSTAGHDWGEKLKSAKFEPRIEAVPPSDSEWPLQELVVPCHPAGTGTKRCCPRDDPGPAPALTGQGDRVTRVAHAAGGTR